MRGPIENLKPYKKGQSGNPAGRPIGAKTLKTRIAELLAAMPPEEVAKAAKRIGLTNSVDARDVMLLAQISKAWKGDTPAARFLAEYTDGKPEQKIIGDADQPIAIITGVYLPDDPEPKTVRGRKRLERSKNQ